MPTSSAKPELTVSAAEANRGFSRLLREVRDGASYVVTSHGRPVAKIVSYTPDDAAREEARKALWDHLNSVKAVDMGPWTREELYEDIY
jgi:prevent-host-death family protein